ncbi:D-alanyl-D-alanine carboxypeptidase/D-alanyl-D-alanine-endopeptidase [Roseovarius faecimaris]|uniref:D-alanyl-D-alanine carboxypeptidase/D-alanyl-D-alanine-endopeptidase n=1 Tax=Roseovarius faecimaris TaxID=2494550 RepID=A0A6I6J361_9RHOB|nr:D-alanyl-D-alanine carboxypeptidase/D-alanyl-D-alanine-endopeptidase [Roseovarius faecimaris]QGX99228.1 D-alanyl-D-alanine carboxypeptidase/D-alanyl-D-alanine-endopeptidase [Roseovarius faecimaris]
MTKPFSRRLFLSGLLSGTATALFAEAPKVSLRPMARPSGAAATAASIKPKAAGAEALIAQAQLGGRVGFSVVDVTSGRVLEESDGRSGQPPASVTKAVTALYALHRLGAGYRFETRLIAASAVQGGVIKGDLILAGGGDPTLDTDALADLARKLKAAGVREIRGTIRPYGGALPSVAEIDRDQPDHVAYNPTVSGLNLNFNRVHFEWKRSGNGYAVTMDARSAKYRPEVRVARMSVAAREMPVYTYADKGDHDAWTVASKALGKGGARWLPVRKPEAYAAEVFATFARAHGIAVKPGKQVRTLPDTGVVLASHKSAPLREILRDMLKYSNNLTAEAVGMAATATQRGAGGSLSRSAQEMSTFARQTLGMSGARFVDHSGLGSASRVSAAAMAQALARVHRAGALKPILKPISMRHENGKINDAHPIKVMAKTGTLYFVSSLAGYMTAQDGTEMAFAIFAVNDQKRTQIDRRSDARPPGSASWNKRAKQLQQKLIERWGAVYGS